jgi:hypothetical protein
MTTMFRKSSAILAIAALVCFAPRLSLAENIGPMVDTKKPKLTAGQFVSNCQNIGGSVTDGGSSGNGGRIVNCEKDNGLGVSCSFDANQPTHCVGTGPRPQ